ncbi:unnamed protein product [Effrenium voratum]|nr:unnamed protein product [Effrenium voratum]
MPADVAGWPPTKDVTCEAMMVISAPRSGSSCEHIDMNHHGQFSDWYTHKGAFQGQDGKWCTLYHEIMIVYAMAIDRFGSNLNGLTVIDDNVGILPVPHPIVIRTYQASTYTSMWFTSYMWGVIFTRSQRMPLYDWKKIRLAEGSEFDFEELSECEDTASSETRAPSGPDPAELRARCEGRGLCITWGHQASATSLGFQLGTEAMLREVEDWDKYGICALKEECLKRRIPVDPIVERPDVLSRLYDVVVWQQMSLKQLQSECWRRRIPFVSSRRVSQLLLLETENPAAPAQIPGLT